MKKEIESLLDRLNEIRTFGNPILIGDVFQKLKENASRIKELDIIYGQGNTILELLRLWGNLDFIKSLQEIYVECEWEEVEDGQNLDITPNATVFIPKQESHREFFKFLLDFNL